MRRRAIPISVAFSLTVLALLPSALALPEHEDEFEYGWSAAYYGGKLARLDLRPEGTNPSTDPGLSPTSYWAQTQPMGSRLIYALALAVTGAPPPAWDGEVAAGYPPSSLLVARLAAVLCAALGLALFAGRLGWRGASAGALLLALPDVRDDLARAWAEGPLLLGFGLCAASYRTRWFAAACGLAATFKLTALALWPLVLWPRAVGGWRPSWALLTTATVWSALTPPSWFSFGPGYVFVMVSYRIYSQQIISALHPVSFGFFLPSRYLWPLELLIALGVACAAPHAWRRLRGPGNVTARERGASRWPDRPVQPLDPSTQPPRSVGRPASGR